MTTFDHIVISMEILAILSFKKIKWIMHFGWFFDHKYKKIINLFHYEDVEIACIGDQLFFDIWGANRMNFTSVLVNPISADEFAVAKLNRKIENMVINKLTAKDLFKRGRYYE